MHEKQSSPRQMPDDDAHPVTAGVMAAFLKTGKCIDHASSVLLLGAFLLYALLPASNIAVAITMLALLLALVQKYFAWRVALDAELFHVLHLFPQETALFDRALARSIGRTTPLPARSLQSRWQGARRLLCRQVVVLTAQVVTTIALL